MRLSSHSALSRAECYKLTNWLSRWVSGQYSSLPSPFPSCKFHTARLKTRKNSWRPPCKSSSPLSSSVPSSSVGFALPSLRFAGMLTGYRMQYNRWLIYSVLLLRSSGPLSHRLVDEDVDFRPRRVGSRTSGLGELGQTVRVSTSLANRIQTR